MATTTPFKATPFNPTADGSRLAAALVKAQGAFPAIERTHTVRTDKFSYKYADLADVLSAVGPALRANGLVLLFGSGTSESGVYVSATLLHESGEAIAATLPLAVSDNPQVTGSRITYLKRYLAALVTGTATEDDDDGVRAADERPRAHGTNGGKKADAIAYVQERLADAFGGEKPWEPVAKAQVVKDLFGSGKWADFLKLPEAVILAALRVPQGGESRFDRTLALVAEGKRRPDEVAPADWPPAPVATQEEVPF
jgi:hypothetical protein